MTILNETSEASIQQAIKTYTKSTLFIHVPKTGGTTLNSIFQDHYYNAPQLPHEGVLDLGKHISKLNDHAYPYIGGHYPLATVDANRFDYKITILREPIELIASAISYVQKLQHLPKDVLLQSEIDGTPIFIFKLFFSIEFDTEKYKQDFASDTATRLIEYFKECTADEAVARLKSFTHVFDFTRLDDEIKYFLIEQNFFPYSQISKKRSYPYQPDKDRARRSLDSFDDDFYRLGKAFFRKIPENIEYLYQRYRENYCKENGLKLNVFAGKWLDLRGPIGTGWHAAERSSDGVFFRWSESQYATIEIPIAEPGIYALIVNVNPAELTGLQISVKTVIQSRTFASNLIREEGLIKCQSFINLKSYDWVQVEINMEKEQSEASLSVESDQRELGLVLQAISISRQA